MQIKKPQPSVNGLHGKSYSHIAAITIPFFSEHCNTQIYTNFGVIYIVQFLYNVGFLYTLHFI